MSLFFNSFTCELAIELNVLIDESGPNILPSGSRYPPDIIILDNRVFEHLMMSHLRNLYKFLKLVY